MVGILTTIETTATLSDRLAHLIVSSLLCRSPLGARARRDSLPIRERTKPQTIIHRHRKANHVHNPPPTRAASLDLDVGTARDASSPLDASSRALDRSSVVVVVVASTPESRRHARSAPRAPLIRAARVVKVDAGARDVRSWWTCVRRPMWRHRALALTMRGIARETPRRTQRGWWGGRDLRPSLGQGRIDRRRQGWRRVFEGGIGGHLHLSNFGMLAETQPRGDGWWLPGRCCRC